MNFNIATKAAHPPAAADLEPTIGKRRARPASIIIRPRDLMALLSVSRHGLARMVADEGLPAPIQLGPRSLSETLQESGTSAFERDRKKAVIRSLSPVGSYAPNRRKVGCHSSIARGSLDAR